MNEVEAHAFLMQDPVDGVGVRINKDIARKWLSQNKGIICGGKVFYLNIKSLGLGIYHVTKAPLHIRQTKIINN